MGLLFPEKINSLLEAHHPQVWVTREAVRARIHEGPAEGFFYRDKATNHVHVISDDAITAALRDAKWWGFLEVEPNRSRLTESARTLKVGKTIAKNKLEPVITDVLHAYTSQWAGHQRAIDVAGFIAILKGLPQSSIPSTQYLWTQAGRVRPDIFNNDALTSRRFKQLLALLGTRGAGRLLEVRTQLHFLQNDSRLADLRRPPH